jgi:hypothetical protein
MKRQFHDGDATRSNEFSDQIEKCVPSLISRPDFHKSLDKFSSFFKDFDDKKSYEILGCFPETKAAQDMANAFRLGGPQEINEAIYLPIVIDSKKANASMILLSELMEKAKNDIEALRKRILPLNSILPEWDAQINDEINRKRLPYDMKIEEITPDVEKKINQLEKEEKEELAPLEQEIGRIESELSQLEEFEKVHEAEEKRAWDDEIDAAACVDQANEDEREAREQLEIYRQQDYEDPSKDLRISQLESRISHARNRISRAEDRLARATQRRRECEIRTAEASEKVWSVERILRNKRQECKNIEDDYSKLIAEEERKIAELEEERDAIINSLTQESKDILTKAEIIRRDVNHLVSRKQHLISEIDSVEMPLALALSFQGTDAFVYVPFFLARLNENGGSKFVVFSPSRLKRDKSTTEKLGGFILGKVPALTEIRDQPLSNLAQLLLKLLETNHPIGKGISEKAEKLNLLKFEQSRETLLKGLDRLCAEGFLNDRMVQKLKSNLPKD